MKTALITTSVLSSLLVTFTMICGFWIQSKGGQITDLASSVNFHVMLAIGTVAVTIITLVLAILKK